MDKIKEFFSKHKKEVIIIGIVLVVLILLGVAFVKAKKAAEDALAAMMPEETAVIEKRELVKSVSATGKVASLKSKDLSATLTGVDVMNITVKVGDTVQEGETLALLDTEEANKRLENAKKVLANAELTGNIASVDGYRHLNDALRGYVYYSYVTSEDSLDAAKNTLNTAQTTLARAQEDYNRFMADYNDLSDDDKKVTAIQTQKATYERAIADAQTAVNNAQNAYDTAQATAINGYYTQQSTVLDSESARVTGELSRNTFEQEMSVENYEKQVEEGVITAPFSGVITAVNYEEGDTYAANTALITIQDVSGYEVKTEIGEYDIPDIKEGQKVIIKTKTTGDLEMTGHVKKVSPVATRQTITTAAGTTTTAATSNSTYEVVISIDDPSDRLRLDMNTNMSIIVDEHDDALTVPYTAVKTDDDGQAYVMVVDETTGEQVKTNVEVVMESNYYTQIRGDGIKEGMTVAIIKDEVSDGSDMEYYFGF